MELTLKNEKLPIKAMTNDVRMNKIGQLITWLTDLLSIKANTENVLKLEVLTMTVEQHAWSLSIDEIKKAFMDYVSGKLPLEPRDNYLTTILFGQVITEWKKQRPTKKTIITKKYTEQEKADLTMLGVINCFDEWKQTGEIIPGYTWIYEHLEGLGLFNYTDKEKKESMRVAKSKELSEAKDVENIFKSKQLISEIEKRNAPAVVNRAKRILIGRYFSSLKTKDKHIKEMI